MNGNGAWRAIRENWFLVVLAASLIGTFATLRAQVATNHANINIILKEFGECKLEVRGMRSDTEHLADMMKEIRDDIKDLR